MAKYFSTQRKHETGRTISTKTAYGITSDMLVNDENILNKVDVPENCRLGARIDTYWAYESSAPCYYPGVGYEAVNWKFYDSTLVKVWDKTDYSSPSTNDVDLCPFVWDGFTPWKLEIKQTQNMQDCVINYNYNVEVYVCACD